jgi:hypothetical protein
VNPPIQSARNDAQNRLTKDGGGALVAKGDALTALYLRLPVGVRDFGGANRAPVTSCVDQAWDRVSAGVRVIVGTIIVLFGTLVSIVGYRNVVPIMCGLTAAPTDVPLGRAFRL